MAKKSRQAESELSAQPESKALGVFSGVLRATARAAARRKTAEARLAAVASGFAGLGDKLANVDPRATAAYTEGLAARALDASTGVAALRRLRASDLADGLAAAHDASAALDGLAFELIRGADSMRLARRCGCHGDGVAEIADVARIKGEIGDAAAAIHLAAVAIRDTYRLNTGTGPTGFRYPIKDGIGCVFDPTEQEPQSRDARAGARIVDPSRLVPELSVDKGRLSAVLASVDQATERLPQTFSSLAALFSALPAISLCRSACSPPLSYIGVPTVYEFGAESPALEASWTPYFKLSWSYCCQDLCFLFFTDEYLVTVRSKHRIRGPGIPFVLDKNRAEKLAMLTATNLVASLAAGGLGTIPPPNRLDVPATEPQAPDCVGYPCHHLYI